MASPSPAALNAYRLLLRATRIAFQGDHTTLTAARLEARKQFDANRRVGIDSPMKVQHALETAEILRTNVVQGVRDADGDAGEERYELRIHEHIERGDNDTIKVAGKGEVRVGVGKTCSSQS
ncbi:Mitochondrial zinc maintenance protein 1, mitochondrial [Onygenales sp. PD_40]|nr:Mitochondrial zinc maintenance protein 1, mitochondrial [Onygenales sp. PD_40]KAK2783195.1 Mitochondrial zinc maintenance protein 1, mitochondrial [Onygenales sp. PD_12]